MKLFRICVALIFIITIVSCGNSGNRDANNAPDTAAVNKIVMQIGQYSDAIQPDSDRAIMTIDNGDNYHYASAMFFNKKFVRIMENIGNKQSYSDIYYTFKSDDLIHVKQVQKTAGANNFNEKNAEYFYDKGNLIFFKDLDNKPNYIFDKKIMLQSDKYKSTFNLLFKKAGA